MNKGVSVSESSFLEQGQALRDLKALEVISQSPSISQRDLAQQLGIALGLTNACLTKLARKGLIKVSRINGRSLAYHLTPVGFSAKAKLSVEYARTTVGLYRTARQAVTEAIGILAAADVSSIALLGVTDVAEIVGIVCAHQGISIVCLFDEIAEVQGTSFMGMSVRPLADISACDCEAVIVAYLDDQEYWINRVRAVVPEGTPVIKAI